MTDTNSIDQASAEMESAPPLVNIGEFWLTGAGLFKAYLPQHPRYSHQPDLDSEQLTLTQVHPEFRPHVATVPDLGAEAKWETSLNWSAQAADDALAKCRQLRRTARLRAGLEP
jgi:hypothetical protein